VINVLVTNDDGVFSDGIKALAEAIGDMAHVVVVAPDREQSASGHSLTLHHPLRIRKVKERWFTVDGTPADCVNLAIHGLLKENPPDLVLAGINFGLNLGNDVTYSGTVSATFEASLHRLPAVAFSQEVAEGFTFERAASFARLMVGRLLDDGLPKRLLLNVNVPADPYVGVEVTRLGHRFYRQTVVEKRDPRGRRYYWIGGVPEWKTEEGTDHAAVTQGRVSITPLHLDLTDYEGLAGYGGLATALDTSVKRAAVQDATAPDAVGQDSPIQNVDRRRPDDQR